MEVVDKVTASIPKSIVFTKKESDILLELLYIKSRHCIMPDEKEITEQLIKGFKSLQRDFDDEERAKAGLW